MFTEHQAGKSVQSIALLSKKIHGCQLVALETSSYLQTSSLIRSAVVSLARPEQPQGIGRAGISLRWTSRPLTAQMSQSDISRSVSPSVRRKERDEKRAGSTPWPSISALGGGQIGSDPSSFPDGQRETLAFPESECDSERGRDLRTPIGWSRFLLPRGEAERGLVNPATTLE